MASVITAMMVASAVVPVIIPITPILATVIIPALIALASISWP